MTRRVAKKVVLQGSVNPDDGRRGVSRERFEHACRVVGWGKWRSSPAAVRREQRRYDRRYRARGEP